MAGRGIGRWLATSQLWVPEVSLRNIGANLCSAVHFGVKIHILNNSAFNLDFGISLMTEGHQKWGGKSSLFHPTFKSGTGFNVSAV